MQKSGLREVRGLLQGLTACKELRWDKPWTCQHLSRILPAERIPSFKGGWAFLLPFPSYMQLPSWAQEN